MRTLEKMSDNRFDKSSAVLPSEIGGAEWSVSRPPSASQLKALLLFIECAAPSARSGVSCELPLPILRQVPGFSGMSVASVERFIDGLRRVDVSFVSTGPQGRQFRAGSIFSEVSVFSNERGVSSVSVTFGPTVLDMLAASDVFAIIDRVTMLGMKSRYSILLYSYLSSRWRKRRNSERLSLADLRRLFVVSSGVYSEFADFRRRVLNPALSELSAVSDYVVSAKPYFEGSRAVAGVVLSWERKAADGPGKPSAKPAGKPSAKPAGKPSAKPAGKSRASASAARSDVLAAAADRVKRRAFGASSMSTAMARDLLAAGLVSRDELRAVQIYVAE